MGEQIWTSVPSGPNAERLIGPSNFLSDQELAEVGAIFSMVRVVEGQVSGLNGKWFGGSAKLQPGQVRVSGVPIAVSRIRLASAHRAGVRHHDHRPLATIEIESGQSLLDWLLPVDQLEAAVHRVGTGRHPAVLDHTGLPEPTASR